MGRPVTIPAEAEREMEEEIQGFTYSVESGEVNVTVGFVESREAGRPQFYREGMQMVLIRGRDFDDLMAEDGNGLAPGKPAGRFRPEDLWPFVDRVRGRAANGL